MAKKRGFFEELHRQNQIAARRKQQQASAAHRAMAAAQRQAEVAARQAEQAAVRAKKASVAEQKAAEREALRLHLEARQAEVDVLNADLLAVADSIDSILASSLESDDHLELETFRVAVDHPQFESVHSRPLLQPPLPTAAPEPEYHAPPGEPSKLGGIFGARKKWEELEAKARQAHLERRASWLLEVEALPALHEQIRLQHAEAEAERARKLADAHAAYEVECLAREREVAEANQRLDELIQGLAYGVDSAVQEYVALVLGNSVYPEAFLVEHDHEFNGPLRELTLTVLVPSPDVLPTAREYKYVRAKDEIVATPRSQKEIKDRYRHLLAQVAVRTMHEIFEADRAGHIRTIALTISTETIDSGTGLMKRTNLVAVAVERTQFLAFDLSNVVPHATLETLGAELSKSPADLVPIDASRGVRGR